MARSEKERAEQRELKSRQRFEELLAQEKEIEEAQHEDAQVVYLLHESEPTKVEMFKEWIAEEIEPPTIQVVEVGGELYALEGTHRLTASSLLGIRCKLLVLEHSESFPGDLEIDSLKQPKTIAELIPYLKQDFPITLKVAVQRR